VGAAKTVKQLVLFEPRDFQANENIDNVNLFRIADHQASLQVVGFSSSRSVKKPIGALGFWSFFAKKKGQGHASFEQSTPYSPALKARR
jgi:hypothetical protein